MILAVSSASKKYISKRMIEFKERNFENIRAQIKKSKKGKYYLSPTDFLSDQQKEKIAKSKNPKVMLDKIPESEIKRTLNHIPGYRNVLMQIETLKEYAIPEEEIRFKSEFLETEKDKLPPVKENPAKSYYLPNPRPGSSLKIQTRPSKTIEDKSRIEENLMKVISTKFDQNSSSMNEDSNIKIFQFDSVTDNLYENSYVNPVSPLKIESQFEKPKFLQDELSEVLDPKEKEIRPEHSHIKKFAPKSYFMHSKSRVTSSKGRKEMSNTFHNESSITNSQYKRKEKVIDNSLQKSRMSMTHNQSIGHEPNVDTQNLYKINRKFNYRKDLHEEKYHQVKLLAEKRKEKLSEAKARKIKIEKEKFLIRIISE